MGTKAKYYQIYLIQISCLIASQIPLFSKLAKNSKNPKSKKLSKKFKKLGGKAAKQFIKFGAKSGKLGLKFPKFGAKFGKKTLGKLGKKGIGKRSAMPLKNPKKLIKFPKNLIKGKPF